MALRRPGSSRATTDKDEAAQLFADRIRELGGAVSTGLGTPLATFVDQFLRDNPKGVTERWLNETRFRLGRAVEFFGVDRSLTTIRPKDVRQWLERLAHLSPSNQRHHLHAVSGLYGYAQEMEVVPLGYNPVSGLHGKPSAVPTRQRTEEFFEIDEAARFLDASRRLDLHYELIGTFLLTGARRSEVFGLLVGDIDLENKLVRIQPNEHRGLKRVWSERAVPLWPQLEDILRPYLAASGAAPAELLFPARSGGMIPDLRVTLGAIAAEAGMERPRLTKFRHTYATARLQTTDGGSQIALWTVAKEMGHKSVARIEDTYGHASHHRPRGEVVEYRIGSE